MRVSQKEMEQSHKRIVDGAARLFREHGIESTSVADVMKQAGLTHGGFYRHFQNKEELTVAALDLAFERIVAMLEAGFEKDSPEKVLTEYFNYYLSQGHVENPGLGCPVAALGGEIAREPEPLKQAFGKGINQVITAFAKGEQGSDEEKSKRATQKLAMLAGAIMIARASDPTTSLSVLSACRS